MTGGSRARRYERKISESNEGAGSAGASWCVEPFVAPFGEESISIAPREEMESVEDIDDFVLDLERAQRPRVERMRRGGAFR